jgi:6-phosphofructokinase 1
MRNEAQPRILIVENSERVRSALQDRIEVEEEYLVFLAANREQAHQKLKEELIHLALVDVRLDDDDDENDQSGLDLCQELDATVARIIVTGYPEEWNVVRSALMLNEGNERIADGFLAKHELRNLIPEIRRVLADRFEIIPERRIAVVTSGGDAPGMNAALWSIVRLAMNNGLEVMGVQGGFWGLVQDSMRRLGWNEVSDILVQGGTILGAGRLDGFEDSAKRAKAVDNLVRKHVSGLIVIGGDGSVCGAEAISTDFHAKGIPFQTIALPGTIDNDLFGTDMTIGAASAANAIIEELRNMIRPAQALQRIFVAEVEGRYCSYLALQAALGIGADAVLLPELAVQVNSPRQSNNPAPWTQRVNVNQTVNRFRERLGEISAQLRSSFAAGKQYGFVVLAEGIGQLTDGQLDGEYVRHYLEDEIRRWDIPSSTRPEVRKHVLGFPIRGGAPCRFDIWLGTRLGAAAIQCLLDPSQTDIMVGWSEDGKVIETSLHQVIANGRLTPKEKWREQTRWHEILALQEALACLPPRLEASGALAGELEMHDRLRASGNPFLR